MSTYNFKILYHNGLQEFYRENSTQKGIELIFFLKGQVSIFIENSLSQLNYGDIIIMPPKTACHICALAPNVFFQMYTLYLEENCYKQLIEISNDYAYLFNQSQHLKQYIFHCNPTAFNTIHTKLLYLTEEFHSNRFGKDTKLQLSLQDLVFHINREFHESRNPYLTNQANILYNDLIQYIEGNLDQELSLDHLSERFFTSKYHISHVFKANLGMSVHQFITKKRLSLCKDAILENKEISKIYQNYGYKDYTGFYRAFKKEYGISPNEFKKISSHI